VDLNVRALRDCVRFIRDKMRVYVCIYVCMYVCVCVYVCVYVASRSSRNLAKLMMAESIRRVCVYSQVLVCMQGSVMQVYVRGPKVYAVSRASK
jgi:hypothetical protein